MIVIRCFYCETFSSTFRCNISVRSAAFVMLIFERIAARASVCSASAAACSTVSSDGLFLCISTCRILLATGTPPMSGASTVFGGCFGNIFRPFLTPDIASALFPHPCILHFYSRILSKMPDSMSQRIRLYRYMEPALPFLSRCLYQKITKSAQHDPQHRSRQYKRPRTHPVFPERQRGGSQISPTHTHPIKIVDMTGTAIIKMLDQNKRFLIVMFHLLPHRFRAQLSYSVEIRTPLCTWNQQSTEYASSIVHAGFPAFYRKNHYDRSETLRRRAL